MLNVLENVLLAPYTTFKIGGPAKYFIKVDTPDVLAEAIKWSKDKKEEVFILGGGSNILVSDHGFNGTVIQIPFEGWKEDSEAIKVDREIIISDSGIALSKILAIAAQHGLSGFEWGAGIPGTIGGAVRGNSGAYGKETGNLVHTISVFDISAMEIKKLSKEECGFYYRGSVFRKNKNLIVLKGEFNFVKDTEENVKSKMKEYILDRVKKNSAALGKSAGCFFKNIPWNVVDKENLLQNFPEIRAQAETPKLSTGFLIDSVGLKGKEIGGALVPNEHANYIINKNNAKAEDVMNIANLIREKIYNKYGIELEEEVELVGFE